MLTATIALISLAASPRWADPLASARYCFRQELSEDDSAWRIPGRDRNRVTTVLANHMKSQDLVDRASAWFALGILGEQPNESIDGLLTIERLGSQKLLVEDNDRVRIVSACFAIARRAEAATTWQKVLAGPWDGAYATCAHLETFSSLQRHAMTMLQSAWHSRLVRANLVKTMTYHVDFDKAEVSKVRRYLGVIANGKSQFERELARELLSRLPSD